MNVYAASQFYNQFTRISKILIVGLILLMLTGCSGGASKLFENSVEYILDDELIIPTPPAYELPTAGFQAPELAGKSSSPICLEVTQKYVPERTRSELIDIYHPTQMILSNLGLQVVQADGDCDLTLSIATDLALTGAGYVNLGYCFTGYDLRFNIKLRSTEKDIFVREFQSEYDPKPGTLIKPAGWECPPPEKGVLVESHENLSAAWRSLLVAGLAEIWGNRVYFAAAGKPYADRAGIEPVNDFQPDEELLKQLEREWTMGDRLARVQPDRDSIMTLVHVIQEYPEAIQQLKYFPEYSETFLPYILPLLRNQNTTVRQDTVNLLGELGQAAYSAVPTLVSAMAADKDNRELYDAALVKITGAPSEDALGWSVWLNDNYK
jgi:hypothetical protein